MREPNSTSREPPSNGQPAIASRRKPTPVAAPHLRHTNPRPPSPHPPSPCTHPTARSATGIGNHADRPLRNAPYLLQDRDLRGPPPRGRPAGHYTHPQTPPHDPRHHTPRRTLARSRREASHRPPSHTPARNCSSPVTRAGSHNTPVPKRGANRRTSRRCHASTVGRKARTAGVRSVATPCHAVTEKTNDARRHRRGNVRRDENGHTGRKPRAKSQGDQTAKPPTGNRRSQSPWTGLRS